MIAPKLIQVLVCFVALLWLSACGQEAEIEDETACQIKIERELDRAVEAMTYLPIPLDSECQSKECRRAEKRHSAENELLMRVYEEHGDSFRRQRYVWAIGFGRASRHGDGFVETGELSIFIYVSERMPQEVVHQEDRLPDRIDCIRVHIKERASLNALPTRRGHDPRLEAVGPALWRYRAVRPSGGRVLTYEHLLRRVWRLDTDADVRPMRTVISSLRRKLGDDAENPSYIGSTRNYLPPIDSRSVSWSEVRQCPS